MKRALLWIGLFLAPIVLAAFWLPAASVAFGVLLIALGLYLARRPSARANLAGGALLGTGSGNFALGLFMFLPLGLVVAGVYFIAKPVVQAFGVDTSKWGTYCGDSTHVPPSSNILGAWTDYKCLDRATAGSRWPRCLHREDYADQQGMGCQDERLCCPTGFPGASSTAPSARASSAPKPSARTTPPKAGSTSSSPIQ